MLHVEEASRSFYAQVGDCIEDKSGRALLTGLSHDEEQHINEIGKQMGRVSQGIELSEIEPIKDLMDVISTMVFPLPPKGACLQLKDEINVVELALNIERRKSMIFKKLATDTKDCGLRDALTTIAGRLDFHGEALEDNLYFLRRGGSWYGYEPILDG